MTTIKDRILQIAEYKKINKENFFLNLDVSYSTFRGKSKLKALSSDTLMTVIKHHPDVNIKWLVTGEGRMMSKSVSDESQHSKREIPIIPISAIGGALQLDSLSAMPYECEYEIPPMEAKDADIKIPVTGDSMAPEYPHMSMVYAKKIDCGSFIEWGRVYVLDTANGAVIKVLNDNSLNNTFVCTSLNSDQTRYAPFEVPKESVFGVYRVLSCISLK